MNQLKKRILLITALLLSMTILSGCMILNAMAAAARPTRESVSTSAPETTAVETDPPSATEPTIGAASDQSFTGIAANLPDDGSLILASDMYNAGTAELLRADPATLEYTISLYTPATGEMTDAFAGTLTGPVSGSDLAYYMQRSNFTVLSSAPLVFEDRLAKTVYCYGDDFSAVEKIDISAWNMCAMVFSKTEKCLYYEDYSDYGLYRYSVETKETARVFTPGSDYDSVWLESILENSGIAVFSGMRAVDKAFIDILVDVKTGAVLCEITGDIDFYESEQGIYAIRQDGSRILAGIFDPSALTFASCCEIDIGSYYTDMYVDGDDGLLFLSTWRDGRSYMISCYDLARKSLVYSDPFDVAVYSSGQVTADGGETASDLVGLSFGGLNPYSKEGSGLMIAADSRGVICDVIFWNLNEAQDTTISLADTEDWDSVVCRKPGLTADSDTNTVYASTISEEFDVTVTICGDDDTQFTNYTVTPIEDEVVAYRSLCTLEETLRLYPDGFFSEFDGDYSNGVIFYLAERINSRDASDTDDLCGFAYSDGKTYKVVISAGYLTSMRSNLVHEISHIIDYHIDDVRYYAGLSYFDEKVWSDMNPADFEYYYDYTDENDVGYEETGDREYTAYSDLYLQNFYTNGVYFVDTYSKTYPTEDRARLMEAALSEGRLPYYIGGKHIQEKLVYYFSAIRAVWDSSEWPAVTTWEISLDADHPLIPADDLLEQNESDFAA